MSGMLRRCALVAAVTAAGVVTTVGAGNVSAAGPKPITAKIPSGYVMVALAKNGTAAVGRTKSGTTTVTPTATVVTLHLLTKSGNYAGPIVVGTKKVGSSTNALLGVKSGAAVGKVTYSNALGYGKATVSPTSIDSRIYAKASKSGVPVGAGRLGLTMTTTSKGVRSAGVSAYASAEEAQPGGDPDKDGIPNAVDVDDNGNGTLDVVDDKTVQANQGMSGPRPFIFSDFFVDLDKIVRVSDAASAEATKEIVKQKLKFVFGMSPENGKVTNARVDCLGITWCATASVVPQNPMDPSPLWSTIDTNNDGKFFDLGKRNQGNTWNYDSSIRPNVYPSDVKPGQMFNFVATYGNGKQVLIPSAITSFFVTAPAPKLIGTWDITYPVATNLGSHDWPIRVDDGSAVRIETYRPMRPVLPTETSPTGMKEMGGLAYWVTVSKEGEGLPPTTCPAEAYSAQTANTTTRQFYSQTAVVDNSPDSSPGEPTVMGFTLNFAKCKASIAQGSKVFVDLNVGDAAFNHSVANFYVYWVVPD